MSYAIIETGGKQLKVEPGRFYDIELLPVEPEGRVILESVLLVQHDGEVTIGQPFIAGATVEGTVMRHFRGRKILVYKMKPKKKTRKKRGHRQEITRLMVDAISMNGVVIVTNNVESAKESEANAETSAITETPTSDPATVDESTANQNPQTETVSEEE